MGLGSTIRQLWFKRFEISRRLSLPAAPLGSILFSFFLVLSPSLLNIFFLIFWLVSNGSLFFLILGLGPQII